jgi:hypothetical protein
MIRRDCRFHLRRDWRRGDVVALDNLKPHKAAEVCVLIEQRGATLRYLPPHSHTPIRAKHSKPGSNHATSRAAAGDEELMRTERPPVTNIIFGTMTLSYQGYLTTRDHIVPLESTLRGVQDLYEGLRPRPRELERVAVWMAQQPNRVIAGHRSSRI